MGDHIVTIALDDELHAAIAREAQDAGSTVAERVVDILHLDYVAPRDGSPYDLAFRAAVEEALAELDDPDTVLISNEAAMEESRLRCERLLGMARAA